MDQPNPEPEIQVTDRRRFSAEGEAIDGADEVEMPATAEPPQEEPPLPPATLEFLVHSLRFQAELQLGLFGAGAKERSEPDLEAARHAIDLLAMLQEKTRGNLSWDEQRLLENSLTELRFRFVQAAEKARPKP